MMKQRWGLDRNVLRPTPGDPWGVEQHHWNNFRNLTTRFENRTKPPAETKACVSFGRWPLGHRASSVHFATRIFSPVSHTSGLSAIFFFNFNNTVFMREMKFSKMFSSSLINGSKAPESSLQSDQKWSLQRGTSVSALKSPLPAKRKSK